MQEGRKRKQIVARNRDRKLSINDSNDCPSRDELPQAPASLWACRLQTI